MAEADALGAAKDEAIRTPEYLECVFRGVPAILEVGALAAVLLPNWPL